MRYRWRLDLKMFGIFIYQIIGTFSICRLSHSYDTVVWWLRLGKARDFTMRRVSKLRLHVQLMQRYRRTQVAPILVVTSVRVWHHKNECFLLVKTHLSKGQYSCLVCAKLKTSWGCHHSSVESSAPTILPPQVQVPRTPSRLLSIKVFVIYSSC